MERFSLPNKRVNHLLMNNLILFPHLMYLFEIKMTSNDNNNYSQNIGMEFDIEKCTMLVVKSGKWHLTDRMEIKKKLECSEKMKPINTWGYWERSWKKKSRKSISGKLENSSSHHHLVVPSTRISLTFSRHLSLSFIASGRSSELHPESSQSCCM